MSPDGQSVDFNGTIFDRIIAKTRRFKVTVKSFTLPNVQTGSIIEYSYVLHWHRGVPDVLKNPGQYYIDGVYAFSAAQWTVQEDLFARRMHFVLRPFSSGAHMEIRSVGLPPEVGKPQHQPDGSVQWDIENIPAFHDEEYSPPQDALKGRVEIFYIVGSLFSDKDFWSSEARHESDAYKKFLATSKAVQQEAVRLVSAADSPETTLRKLYERVQRLRFVSFEPTRTEQEQKRENLKPNKTVEDVLTRGYAFANEANLLFVALAREAGFSAHPVRVTSRDRSFFLENIFDPDQLNAEVVEVQAGPKTFYLDPATLYCPFGLLPWEETDTQGIRLDSFDGRLVAVPGARSADAVLARQSRFKLDSDGNLQGKLDITFLGQEALSRRLLAVNQDESGRRKELEDEVKRWLPQNAAAKLSTVSGWDGSAAPLRASFEVQVPGFGSQTGGRLIVPAVLFHSRWEKSFQASQREHPVYLNYGYQELDEITLELPENYSVEKFPAPQGMQERFGSYWLSTEKQGTSLSMKHRVVMDGYYFPVEQYPRLRNFYDFVRTNDEELIVLHAASAGAGH